MYSFNYHALKFVITLPCLFIIPGLIRGIGMLLNMSLYSNPEMLIGLLLIAGGFFLHNKILIKFSYFNTYIHETHHSIMGVIFGREIKRRVITTDQGGLVEYSNGSGGLIADFLCFIAPYCIPFYLVFALIAGLLVPEEFKFIPHIIIYIMIGSYISAQYQDTKLAFSHPVFMDVDNKYMRSDLNYIGFFFSFIFIFTVNALNYSSILVYLNNGVTDMLAYLKLCFDASLIFWTKAFYLLKTFLEGAAGKFLI